MVLYAAGAIATAVLYAKRRFAITSAAPIGNTVVMVLALLLFRASVGPEPGFDLSTAERWLLVLAGTGGVVAYVGILLGACRATGFRLRPRWRVDAGVREVLGHAGWGVVLHTGAGILLAGAIVLGGSEAGAVVAYQAAWVFFLAPYAILAQPIHTAILPELVVEAKDDDLVAFRDSVRWSLERIALLTLPVAAGMVALALPAMRVASFGEAATTGPGLLAAGLAALAVGLFPYSAFLLLSRACYALGDSRTPGVVSLLVAAGGVIAMALASLVTEGAARVAVLGGAHSGAYLVGAIVLTLRLARRTAGSLWPAALGRVLVVAVAVGGTAWLAVEALLAGDEGRVVDLATCAGVGALGAVAVVVAYRALGLPALLTTRSAPQGAGG